MHSLVFRASTAAVADLIQMWLTVNCGICGLMALVSRAVCPLELVLLERQPFLVLVEDCAFLVVQQVVVTLENFYAPVV